MIRPEIVQIKRSLALHAEGSRNDWKVKKEIDRYGFSSSAYYLIKHKDCNISILVLPQLFGRLFLSRIECNNKSISLSRKEKAYLNKYLRRLIKRKKAADNTVESNLQNVGLRAVGRCLTKTGVCPKDEK